MTTPVRQQPIYQLKPLFDVFADAGREWQTDEAVQKELHRQQLSFVEEIQGYIQFGKLGSEQANPDFAEIEVVVVPEQFVTAYYQGEEPDGFVTYQYGKDKKVRLTMEGFDRSEVGFGVTMEADKFLFAMRQVITRIRTVNRSMICYASDFMKDIDPHHLYCPKCGMATPIVDTKEASCYICGWINTP